MRAYTIALAATWVASIVDATIPSFWLLVHPFHRWWRARSSTALKLLATLWILLWAVAAALTWPLLFRTLYQGWWSWVAGSLFWAAGLWVYASAMQSFSLEQLFGVPELRPQRGEQRLVASGIRGRLRHPIYTGHLLLLAGNCAASGLIANYLLFAWFLLTLPLMLRFEERELEQRFGEAYREYKRRVPAIIPRAGR
ncbi:MAG TPA: isoprenylcysteine carboxylmethyltransferase family protein [Terriglobales bacterium]|nr:isoprenylcysteine carboxylmethyltransferase family protein [Terriglobales bacterium]